MGSREDLEFLNPHEIEKSIFESNDLHDCLQYFEETNDIEPLRQAISHNAKVYHESKKLLLETIDIIQHNDLAKTKIELVIKNLKG